MLARKIPVLSPHLELCMYSQIGGRQEKLINTQQLKTAPNEEGSDISELRAAAKA